MKPHPIPNPTGFGRENTWIGLNDRIVERDFQWTDNTGLVSGGSLGLCYQAADWGPTYNCGIWVSPMPFALASLYPFMQINHQRSGVASEL